MNLENFVTALSLIFITSSCSSIDQADEVTTFQKAAPGKNGYQLAKVTDQGLDTYFAAFTGNYQTSEKAFRNYVSAVAIHICEREGQMPIYDEVLNYQEVEDNKIPIKRTALDYQIIDEEVEEASSTTYLKKIPLEISKYDYILGFTCDDNYKVFTSNMTLSKVNPVLLNKYVNDFMGGLMVEKVSLKSSLNGEKMPDLKKGDVILNINGSRVTSEINLPLSDLNKEFVDFDIVRSGKNLKVKIPFYDQTEQYSNLIAKRKSDICSFEQNIVDELNASYKKRRVIEYKRDHKGRRQAYYKTKKNMIPFCQN
jgi:hypothetical protein